MSNLKDRSAAGFGLAGIIAIVLVVGVLAGVGYVVFKNTSKHDSKSAATQTSTTATPPTPSLTPSAPSKKTYTSKEEQVTFQYPDTWTSGILPSNSGSVTQNSSDSVTLKSPSGAITITWIPSLAAFANDHNDAYPLEAVLDKTPIPNASGLFVVSGTTTLDGKTFYPWIAVQDSQGITKSGVQGDVLAFVARHAKNTSTGGSAYALFSTSGLRANVGSPALTQDQTSAWFSGNEAQQAKQILLSLTYPQ